MYQQPKCPYSYFSLALEFDFRVLFPVSILKFSNVPAKLQRCTLPFIQISKIQFRYYFTGMKGTAATTTTPATATPTTVT